MKIKFETVTFSPPLTVEPQSFGPVKSKEDLKAALIEIIIEQAEIDVTLNDDDLDAFYYMIEKDGSVVDE